MEGYKYEVDNGILFSFIRICAIISGIFLITVLKPHRLYKRLLTSFLNYSFKFRGADWQIYHILIVIIFFFLVLFSFLQMQNTQYKPDATDTFQSKLSKLDKKWLNEMEEWLTFFIIICLISVYRCSMIFSYENKIKNEIEDIKKQIEEATSIPKN